MKCGTTDKQNGRFGIESKIDIKKAPLSVNKIKGPSFLWNFI